MRAEATLGINLANKDHTHYGALQVLAVKRGSPADLAGVCARVRASVCVRACLRLSVCLFVSMYADVSVCKTLSPSATPSSPPNKL